MSQDLDTSRHWLDALHFDDEGLIPAIAQDAETGAVLMMAWMNRVSLMQTVETGDAVYWSRSRQCLWRKGEESGNTQQVVSLRTDCDGDTILLQVTQKGGIACHTGRASCFFYALSDERWTAVDPVLRDPKEMYQ
ncbi:MAG: phosphoribosyl-AMP cyclohydrolase [Pseudomonadota bacterium]|jgi:phosphoribosyl-AMP cyclohydrolase